MSNNKHKHSGGLSCSACNVSIIMEYWILLFKESEPNNRAVHFRSSGVLLINLVGLKYQIKIMFIIDCSHKTIQLTCSF